MIDEKGWGRFWGVELLLTGISWTMFLTRTNPVRGIIPELWVTLFRVIIGGANSALDWCWCCCCGCGCGELFVRLVSTVWSGLGCCLCGCIWGCCCGWFGDWGRGELDADDDGDDELDEAMSNTFFKLPTKPSNIRNLISIVRRFDDDEVSVRGDDDDDDDDEQHSLFWLFVALVFWLIVDIDE